MIAILLATVAALIFVLALVMLGYLLAVLVRSPSDAIEIDGYNRPTYDWTYTPSTYTFTTCYPNGKPVHFTANSLSEAEYRARKIVGPAHGRIDWT